MNVGSRTKIMGIINVTPDSFYAASRTFDIDRAIEKGILFEKQGADILDIGGESTRPFSNGISEEEEKRRVLPVIEALRKHIKIPISIDTTKPKVARAAIEKGASFINDVSGFSDPEMLEVAREHNIDLCVMHKLGSPQTMQLSPKYEKGVVHEVYSWIEERAKLLLDSGIDPKKIIIDPGIGFGKSFDHNIELLRNIHKFRKLGFQVLIGVSRKSFLSKLLSVADEELLCATIALNTWLMQRQVDYIRVHDVKEHKEAYLVLCALNAQSSFT